MGTDNALYLRDFVGLLILDYQPRTKQTAKKPHYFADQFCLVKIVKSLQTWPYAYNVSSPGTIIIKKSSSKPCHSYLMRVYVQGTEFGRKEDGAGPLVTPSSGRADPEGMRIGNLSHCTNVVGIWDDSGCSTKANRRQCSGEVAGGLCLFQNPLLLHAPSSLI